MGGPSVKCIQAFTGEDVEGMFDLRGDLSMSRSRMCHPAAEEDGQITVIHHSERGVCSCGYVGGVHVWVVDHVPPPHIQRPEGGLLHP